jgi:HEAT repeat protein
MAFQERPDRYLNALVTSSQIESNERVRAFSTRTLGKFRRPTLALHFRRLLADQSPFVRQNAAWALGELANVSGGREAARLAIAELVRARAKDIDGAVRAAARGTLNKIE